MRNIAIVFENVNELQFNREFGVVGYACGYKVPVGGLESVFSKGHVVFLVQLVAVRQSKLVKASVSFDEKIDRLWAALGDIRADIICLNILLFIEVVIKRSAINKAVSGLQDSLDFLFFCFQCPLFA